MFIGLIQNERLHNLSLYRNTIRIIEAGGDDMAERVMHMLGIRSVHTILVEKAKWKTHLRR